MKWDHAVTIFENIFQKYLPETEEKNTFRTRHRTLTKESEVELSKPAIISLAVRFDQNVHQPYILKGYI